MSLSDDTLKNQYNYDYETKIDQLMISEIFDVVAIIECQVLHHQEPSKTD